MRPWEPAAWRAESNGAAISAEVSPELLGVGYIIGTKISCIMAAGGVLAAWVLTPLIKLVNR